MSAEIDLRQLQRYLLGQLPPVEREHAVERLAQDERYFEAAEALEVELRDAYVRGELSPKDLQDFQQHLLRTPRQREETALARYLAEALDRPLSVAPVRIPRLAWWGVAAAAVLALIAGWTALENRSLREELTAARRPIPAAAPIPPAASPSPPAVASLYLAGIVVRGSETPPVLTLSPQTQLVRLEADPELDGPLHVQLENSSGTPVWTQPLPPNTASPLQIWVPASGLAAGIYTLRIDGATPPRQTVYRFRVSLAKTQTGAQSPSTIKPAQ